jgi:hypothetical protein
MSDDNNYYKEKIDSKIMQEEKYYKISGEDYSIKLIPKRTIDSDKKRRFSSSEQLWFILTGAQHYISKIGKVEYKKDHSETSKNQVGNFEEIWIDDIHGDCRHTLMIELNDKPKKRIQISEMDYDTGRSILERKAFEKAGLFSKWKEIPFEEIKK